MSSSIVEKAIAKLAAEEKDVLAVGHDFSLEAQESLRSRGVEIVASLLSAVPSSVSALLGTMHKREPAVFLSYARAHSAVVQRVADGLVAAGWVAMRQSVYTTRYLRGEVTATSNKSLDASRGRVFRMKSR